MSKLILSENDGFTPVIDSLAQEYGAVTALVFGRVWRFCQMSNRVCNASLETIAVGIGISLWTAERHIKTLVKAGYLEDLTPNLRKHPHTYRDTGKATASNADLHPANLVVQNTNPDLQPAPTGLANSQLKKVLREEEETIKKPEDSSFSFEEQEQIQELNQLQEQKPLHSREEANELITSSKTEERAALPTDDTLATREEVNAIIERELRINISPKNWDEFVKLPLRDGRAYTLRFTKLIKGGDPSYWHPAEFIKLWPQVKTIPPIEPTETPALDKWADDPSIEWATSLEI
jgi:hypothetical protein